MAMVPILCSLTFGKRDDMAVRISNISHMLMPVHQFQLPHGHGARLDGTLPPGFWIFHTQIDFATRYSLGIFRVRTDWGEQLCNALLGHKSQPNARQQLKFRHARDVQGG